MVALFPLGQVVATPGALAALERAKQPATCFLDRHAIGDWGELDQSDVAENEYSMVHGFRLLSSYQTDAGEKLRDEQISVNVIPKPLKSDQQGDDAALTTPLSVTGAPKELDEQLPRQLVEFVKTHLELSSTLKSAKEQMAAAAKAAREAARKPTTSKSHSGSSRSVTPSLAQVQTETGTKESSDDSQSSPELTHATTAGSGGGGLGASTGSLLNPAGGTFQ